MGTLIKFPKKKKGKRKLEDVLIEKLPEHDQYSNLGDIKFTCASCGTISNFKFSYAIFKICEFYCGVCGVGYKISNPIFGKKQNNLKNQ